MTLPIFDDRALMAAAREAMGHAYAPYSHFPVGAALLAEDGRVFVGCNVENASFGLTLCAERSALVKAVSEGARRFVAVAIAAEKLSPCPPCGACRQVMAEFSPELQVILEDHAPLSLAELLPMGFAGVWGEKV